MLTLILSTLAFAVFLSNAIPFVRNLRAARATGLPYIIRPCGELNYVLALIEEPLVAFLDQFPLEKTFWVYFYLTARMWRFRLKHELHRRVGGDVFLVVSPGWLSVEVADKDVSLAAARRERTGAGWGRCEWQFAPVEVYGRSVVTTEGTVHRKHRRNLAPHFGDKMYVETWKKSIRSASSMFGHWQQAEKQSEPIDFNGDINAFGLGISVSSIFGFDLPYTPTAVLEQSFSEKEQAGSEKEDVFQLGVRKYLRSIHNTLGNFIKVLIFPPSLMRLMGSSGKALADDSTYVRNFLEDTVAHKNLDARNQNRAAGIAQRLIQAAHAEEEPLSISEAVGNLFMLTLAGSGSTSDTLNHCLVLLALNPDVQEWVYEEIHAVTQGTPSSDWPEDVGPKFTRAIMVMYEILRLLPTQLAVTTWNPTTPAPLDLSAENGGTIILPPKTMLNINLPGLQYNNTESHWSADAHEFCPQRHVADGAFASFNRGMHMCLGKKVAEAMIVGTIAVILSGHVLKVKGGKEAEERAKKSIEMSTVRFTLTLEQDVKFEFVKRG